MLQTQSANTDPAAPRRAPYKLAILASHVIQYQDPLFRELAKSPELDITVFFCSQEGLKQYRDPGFGREVKWDIPMLEGYRSVFLRNRSPRPHPSTFFGLINPEIISQLRSGGFDAVIIHGWVHVTNWLAILTGLFSGIPVIIRGESNTLPRTSGWRQFLKRTILPWLFSRVHGLLSIGRYNSEFYRAYGAKDEQIFFVPYAVNNDYFIAKGEAVINTAELRKQLGIDPRAVVVLVSGKLSHVKRPLDLLRAFERAAKGRNAALIYLGDGILRGELEAYIRDHQVPNVHLVGFHNQSELAQFFKMADIFVLPSGREPWGLVVNEALCFGLPVIVSDQVGSSGDLVREGVNGYVFPATDVDALATKLANLIDDPETRKRMGEASSRIIARYSYAQDVEGILECLGSISEGTLRS